LAHRVADFVGSIGCPKCPASAVTLSSQAYEVRICLPLALQPWTGQAIRHAGLPFCVPPVTTLTYYRFGSRAPHPLPTPKGRVHGRFGRLASPGSAWAVLRR